MKIAFLISDFSLERGGERATASLANALSKSNQVELVSLYQKNGEAFYQFDSNIKIKTLRQGKRSELAVVRVFYKIKELWSVAMTIYKSDPTIWIGVGTYCSILLGMFNWLKQNPKYLAWEHSNYLAPSPKWKKLRNIFYKKLDGIICLNETDRHYYQKEFNKVYVIPNLNSIQITRQAKLSKKQILAIGALEIEKGFDLLIEAFHLFPGKEEWTLLIIGNGSQKDVLQKLIVQHDLAERITILSYTQHIIEAYLNAGIYVLPSRREGFGMVLIEAMACGLPVIAFDCESGPAHIVSHEINGLLVPAEDSGKLSETIALLAKDKALVKRLVAGANQSLEKYSSAAVLPLWDDVFTDINT